MGSKHNETTLGLSETELVTFERLARKIVGHVVQKGVEHGHEEKRMSVATGFEVGKADESRILIVLSCGPATHLVRSAISFLFSPAPDVTN